MHWGNSLMRVCRGLTMKDYYLPLSIAIVQQNKTKIYNRYFFSLVHCVWMNGYALCRSRLKIPIYICVQNFLKLHSQLLKLVFSEIQVRTWVQVVSRPKNMPLIGRTDRSANHRPFLAGNHLNSCLDSDLRKKWL